MRGATTPSADPTGVRADPGAGRTPVKSGLSGGKQQVTPGALNTARDRRLGSAGRRSRGSDPGTTEEVGHDRLYRPGRCPAHTPAACPVAMDTGMTR